MTSVQDDCHLYLVGRMLRLISVAATTLAASIPRCTITVTAPSGEVVVVVVETQDARLRAAAASSPIIVVFISYLCKISIQTHAPHGKSFPASAMARQN